ncbi:DUF58 domain-containing protein [Rhodobacteraceae bacterium RKSG542]|nr:DUF58 domain-containing protein [Pseudovibrio flavus]
MTSMNRVAGEARQLSSVLPTLLVEARSIANTVSSGWHGRRRSGPGENFWQFRPFMSGEPSKRIDWRRSARDDHLYVREREWEASHTFWLWADASPSMQFQSNLSGTTKQHRALLLLLALSDMLSATGERVGIPDLSAPVTGPTTPQRLAQSITFNETSASLPETHQIRRFSETIVFSDFFESIDKTKEWVAAVSATGAKGHLVQIMDPIEETFPFSGRYRFDDPESDLRLTAGRAENWKEDYFQKLAEHKQALKDIAAKAGWSFITHHTDRPATEPLLLLHTRLTNPDQSGAVS